MALLLALLLLSPSHAFIPLTHTSPLKIALLVEPTPFNYISGYANRFKEMLKFLHQANDQVQIITADSDKNAPDNFMGFPIITNRGFTFPWYKSVILSLDFAGSLKTIALRFKPDIIHVAAPGMLVFPAIACAKSLDIPLVMSYHTNVFEYTKAYFKFPGNIFTAKQVLYHTLSKADLLLTTSPQLKRDLEEIGLTKIDVWQKGINAERFSPSFRTDEMRNLLSANNPDSPLLVYVGRLGLEKKIEKLRAVLDANPSARLAVVGDGPERKELERVFAGYPVVFAGVMVGDALSSAFASADVFVMPSDTETLGFVVLEAMASGALLHFTLLHFTHNARRHSRGWCGRGGSPRPDRVR